MFPYTIYSDKKLTMGLVRILWCVTSKSDVMMCFHEIGMLLLILI